MRQVNEKTLFGWRIVALAATGAATIAVLQWQVVSQARDIEKLADLNEGLQEQLHGQVLEHVESNAQLLEGLEHHSHPELERDVREDLEDIQSDLDAILSIIEEAHPRQ